MHQFEVLLLGDEFELFEDGYVVVEFEFFGDLFVFDV